jgi:hypothetical protein
MEIKAYKCMLCRTIFEDETKFKNHQEYCDHERLCDEVDKLFRQKVECGEGWKEEKREEVDREYDDPQYKYYPEITKASKIDEIETFSVTERYMVTEEVIYVKIV